MEDETFSAQLRRLVDQLIYHPGETNYEQRSRVVRAQIEPLLLLLQDEEEQD